MNDELTGTGIAEPPAETAPNSNEQTRRAPEKQTEQKRATAQGKDAETPPGPARSVWREYFESAVVTIIMALFGMTFVVQAVKVPTGSMQNTILIGDHLLVNKFIFAPGTPAFFLPQREIRRGDIVVFKYPGNQNDPRADEGRPDSVPYRTNFVKRVVGLPGDRIEIRGDRFILINGDPLPERHIAALDRHQDAPLEPLGSPAPTGEGSYTAFYSPERIQDPTDEIETYTVPPGQYFVMGDNRDNSADSRTWGFVPRELVIGRAMFVYWSYDNSAPPSGYGFLGDFIQNTRWSRTGTLVR